MTTSGRTNAVRAVALVALLVFSCPVRGDYLKVTTPPDIDKDEAGEFIDCWLITSATMLAGAGHGPADNMQENAEIIYEHLKDEFPPSGG